jgi:hypothetical protein
MRPGITVWGAWVVLGVLLAVGAGGTAPRPLGAPGETLESAVAEAEEAARASRVRIEVSAVGIGISPQSAAARDLQAASAAGGGVYVPAAEAGQLAGALRQALSGEVAAPKARAALLPVPVLRGAAENGARVAQALGAAARSGGLALVGEEAVLGTLATLNVDPKAPQPLPRLVELGRALGVDWVLHARVLSVGRPFNATSAEERSLIILLNVVDVKTGRLRHTAQIGPTFLDPGEDRKAVVPAEVAAAAAERLLGGLHQKL